MTDQYVQVQADSVGKKIDTSEIVVGVNTVERQRIVLADPTHAANFVTVTDDGSLQVQPTALLMTGSAPAPGFSTSADAVGQTFVPIQVDVENQVMARSAVFTDEGSLRDDFLTNALVETMTGTVTFVAGSDQVVGTGTLFTTEIDQYDYLRLSTHGETAFTRVAGVTDDTHLTLEAGYKGASASGTGFNSDWPTTTVGTGMTAAESNSLLTIATGTTSGAALYLWRGADYPPFTFVTRCTLSQMIANQEFGIGFVDNVTNPGHQARLTFSGTDPSKVTFTVGTSPLSANQQTMVATIPNGLLTGYNTFKIDLQTNNCVLTINNVTITQFNYHTPYPYQTMMVYMYAKNTGTAASSTTFSADWIEFSNYDVLQVGSSVPLKTHTIITTPQGDGIPPWYATVTPNQRLRVSGEAFAVFSDNFDGASIDQAARWTVSTGGTGTASQASGNLVLSTGTTASNAAAVASQPTYTPSGVNYGLFTVSVKIEATPIITNAHRFWGLGTPNASFTAAAPLNDAIGFEIDTTGALNAVIYAGGTKVFSQNLTLATDGAFHRYRLLYRPDQVNFFIDTWDIPYARSQFQSPNVQALPVRVHMINGTTAPTTAPTINIMNVALGDSGPNSTSIADGTYPWREITIGPKGTQGTYGLMVQNMKDAGRTMMTVMVDNVAGATSEGLFSGTLYRAGATSSSSNFTVSSGKTFRITSMAITVVNGTAILSNSRVRLRSSFSTGATTTGSAIVAGLQAAVPVSTTGAAGTAHVSFADGVEIPGGYTFAISHVENTTTTVTVCITGFEY